MLKKEIDEFIDILYGEEKLKQLGRKSMEEICQDLLGAVYINEIYHERDITITASEDNENSGVLEFKRPQ